MSLRAVNEFLRGPLGVLLMAVIGTIIGGEILMSGGQILTALRTTLILQSVFMGIGFAGSGFAAWKMKWHRLPTDMSESERRRRLFAVMAIWALPSAMLLFAALLLFPSMLSIPTNTVTPAQYANVVSMTNTTIALTACMGAFFTGLLAQVFYTNFLVPNPAYMDNRGR